jgi:dihydroxyacetone kinase DhaKLM complex PTS-EIIA-like component DhaM
VNERDTKLARKATQVVKIAEGQEIHVFSGLASEQANLESQLVEQLVQAQGAASNRLSDVAIVFGAEVSGKAIEQLVGLRVEAAR